MRSYYVLGGVVVIAIALGASLYFFGPSSLHTDVINAVSANQSTKVSFTILARGTDASGITNRGNYRIKSKEELVALWQMVYGTRNTPALPTVDFSKYEVLGIFDGSHRTSGYALQVASVMDANGERDVVINHTAPGSGCSTAKNATSPFEIIQVPITSDTLAHQDDMSTTTCP
jgi:hypothetical protein